MLNVIFNEITPADEDSPEVGARPYRYRCTIVNNGVAVWDIEEFNDDTDFRLAQSAGLLSQLALALGAAEMLENQDVDLDAEAFCDDLLGEVYVGEEVIVTVGNRPYKNRAGEDMIDDGPRGFASLGEGEDEDLPSEEIAEEEEESEAPEPQDVRRIRKRTA